MRDDESLVVGSFDSHGLSFLPWPGAVVAKQAFPRHGAEGDGSRGGPRPQWPNMRSLGTGPRGRAAWWCGRGAGKTEYRVHGTECSVAGTSKGVPNAHGRHSAALFASPVSRNPGFLPVALTWREATLCDAPGRRPTRMRARSGASNRPLKRTNMQKSKMEKKIREKSDCVFISIYVYNYGYFGTRRKGRENVRKTSFRANRARIPPVVSCGRGARARRENMPTSSDHTVADRAEGRHAGQSPDGKALAKILPDQGEGRCGFHRRGVFAAMFILDRTVRRGVRTSRFRPKIVISKYDARGRTKNEPARCGPRESCILVLW